MSPASMFRVEKGNSVDNRVMSGKCTRAAPWLLLALCMAHPAAGKDAEVIASFEKQDSVQDWVSVNDEVMGGVSKGGFERTGGKR